METLNSLWAAFIIIIFANFCMFAHLNDLSAIQSPVKNNLPTAVCLSMRQFNLYNKSDGAWPHWKSREQDCQSYIHAQPNLLVHWYKHRWWSRTAYSYSCFHLYARHEGCNQCWSTNKFCPLTFLNGYNTIRGSWSCYRIIIKGPSLMKSYSFSCV